MKRNMGVADRIIRISLSAVMGVLLLERVLTGAAGIVFGVLSAVLLLTSLAGFCPLYRILDISSKSENENKN